MNKKNTSTLLLYVCLLSAAGAFAQNPAIDSLKKKLATSKADTGRINILTQLGSACYTARDYKCTGHYGQLALELAQKLKYKKGEAAAFGLIGRYHYKNNRDTAALGYFTPALKINLELGDPNETGQSYIDIAGPYYQMGNYSEALKYSYLSLKMYEQARNIKRTGYVWMRIGIVQYYLKSYPESLAAFEEALQFAKQSEDKSSEAFAIKNIGVIYFIQAETAFASKDTLGTLKKCEASIANYIAALKIYEKQGDGYGMMETYHPLGNSYEKIAAIAKSRNNTGEAAKNTALALENFLAFLHGAEKFNDRNYISEAHYALGSLFLKQKNTTTAEKHLKKGLQIAIDIAMKGDIKIGYCHLADLYSNTGDYKQAFNYHKLCASYSDSLVNDENKKKALQTQMNYEVEKKEDELK